jgi:hypothetical protein
MPTDGEIRARAHPFPKKRVSRRDEGTSSGTKQNGSCSTTKLSPISRKALSVRLRSAHSAIWLVVRNVRGFR